MERIQLSAEIRIYKNPYGTEYDRIAIRVKNERDPDYDKVLNFDAYGFDTTEKVIAVALKQFGRVALKSGKGGGQIREVKPLTNADRIRAMSDEELAGFLMKLMHNNIQCFGEGMFPYHPCPQEQNCKQCGLDWLQRPSGEEDKHETD